MKHLFIGLAIGLVIAACGARSPRSAQPAAVNDGGGVGALEGRPTEEIRALDEQITTDMASLGLEPPTDKEVTEMVVAHSVPPPVEGSVADSCEAPPDGEGCSDVCTLADSICKNADRICDLADQLPGDEWAVQRCASGRGSCDRAKTRCCGC
jgi:hypothetical protein